MTLAHSVIVKVMSWGDFHAARSEVRINVVIGNDRYLTIRQGKENRLSNQVGVSLICGINRDSRIAQHCLGPGRCDGNRLLATRNGITQMPQATRFFLLNDLKIRDGGMKFGIPVHEALTSVNQAFMVEANEDFLDSLGQLRVHSKTLAGPIN